MNENERYIPTELTDAEPEQAANGAKELSDDELEKVTGSGPSLPMVR